MPQVSSRTRCAAGLSAKIEGIDAATSPPPGKTDNPAWPYFYWVSATIGRSECDAAGPRNARVHRAYHTAQLCVTADPTVPICFDRHKFATGSSVFLTMVLRPAP